ncbi:hypothetical protein DZB84_01415 [Bacillus sp. HNG]|uniref:hypothetical protein n=1 Tax=Bacillus sp. HNG TaxID=2293325 RepID=UPI000E2EAC59|nr:hypothetical protein [Bacillus sp. HNG]RFB18940.1 hypothetical protein DZB84_01415 [Bacillus sp. HNG]
MEVNSLISGDIEENAFVLTQFKHMKTQSVISRERLEALCDYLMKKVESGEQEHFITLNDQMPVRINHSEMEELLQELIDIRGKLS